MSVSLAAVLALGFFLGMRHATDADHVLAVSTIVTRERSVRFAALIGAMWGAGHTITIMAVGVAIILFKIAIPARLGLTMEFSVALMLILLGAWNIFGFSSSVDNIVHAHATQAPTQEDAARTAHHHSHRTVVIFDRLFSRFGFYQLTRPLLIGIVHGLAGSAAVALLVLTTLQNTRWAVAYLLIFGVGTIAGMMIITVALASAIHFSQRRSSWIGARLSYVAGYLSLGFGLFIAYQIGIVDGLFTHNPHWTPK